MSKELYSSIGLTDFQYEIYSIISSKLVRTLEEIELLTNKSKEEISEVISFLEEKRFIRVISAKVPQYLALTPPIAVSGEINKHLTHEVASVQEEVAKIRSEIEGEINLLLEDFKNGLSIFTDSQKELINIFESVKDSLVKTQEEGFNNAKTNIEKAIDHLNKKNNTTLSEYLQDFKKQIQVSIDQIENQFRQIKEKLDAETKTNIEQVDKLHGDNQSRIDTFLNNLVSIVQSIEEKNQKSHQELSEFLIQIHKQLLNQNTSSNNEQITEIQNLSDEIFPKLSDKLTILNNSLENIENELLQLQEDSFQKILSSVKEFTKESLAKSLNEYLKEFESLIKKDLHSFFAGLEELFGQLDTFSQNFKPTEFENIITAEFSKEKATVTETLSKIKDDFSSTISEFDKSIGQKNTRTYEQIKEELLQVSNSLTEILNKENDQLTLTVQNFEQTISQRIGTTIEVSSSSLEELHEKLKEIINSTLSTYDDLIVKTFNESNKRIESIISTFDKQNKGATSDITTIIDKINLKIKDIIKERKSKIEQTIQYLQNVTVEELDSYSTSINMMFGQMGTTISDGVGNKTDSIEKNIKVLNENLDENLKDFSENILAFIKDNHDKLLDTITTFNDNLVNKLSEDINYINNAIETLTNESDDIKSKRIESLGITLDDFNDKFEKINSGIRKSIPDSLDEIQARNLDDLNSFDRTFKKEFNKLMLRLNEIDKEVQSRLGKRVSLGKGGFEDIGQIVTTAKEEFQTAQKLLNSMIEEQINNFKQSNDDLAERINSSLNKQQLQTERLFVSITDTINESIEELYSRLMETTKLFANNTIKQIQTSIDSIKTESQPRVLDLLKQESNKQKNTIEGFMSRFRENYKSYQQIAEFPKEIESYLQSEMNNFNETLRLALQTTIESSKSTIHEVISNSLKSELKSLFTQLQEQDLTKARDNTSSTLASLSENTIGSLKSYNSTQTEKQSSLLKEKQTLLTEIDEKISSMTHEISTKNVTLLEEVAKQQIEITDDITKELHKGFSTLDNSISNGISSLIDKTKSNLQEISEVIATTNNSFATTISDLSVYHDKIKGSLDNLENIFLTEFNQKLGNVTSVLTSIRDDSLNKLKMSKDKFNSEIAEEFKKFTIMAKNTSDFESQLKDQVKLIEKTLNQKKQPLQMTITKTKKNFEKDIKDLIKTTESDIKTMKKNLEQRSIQQKADNETLFESYKTRMNSFVESSRTMIEQLAQQEKSYNQELESLQRYLDECKDTQLKIISETSNAISEVLQEYSANISQETDQLTANFTGTTELLQSKSNEKLTETLEIFVNTMKKINESNVSSFNEGLNKSSTTINNKVGTLTKEFQSRADELKGKSVNKLGSSIESIPSRINSHIGELINILGLLESVQQTASQIGVTPLDTTFIENIKIDEFTQLLETILSRTKSTIQMMIPRLSMLPLDKIKQTTRQRIQILTNVNDPIMLDQLKELSNVQLRHIEGMESVFAIARDGTEEAFVGASKESQFQLINTTDENLVGLLKDIIQDYWPRGRAQ